jgi:hypothetical protein
MRQLGKRAENLLLLSLGLDWGTQKNATHTATALLKNIYTSIVLDMNTFLKLKI